jgi:hypothetical protein
VTSAPGGGALASSPSDAWYPPPGEYWVTPPDDAERPFRYGDLFHAPAQSATGTPLTTNTGEPWHAVMVLSPSCEVISKAKDTSTVEVARVVPLSGQDPKAGAAIVAGWQEKQGRVTVAFASTVFLAGVPHAPTHEEGMFADLRQTTRVTMADLRGASRIAALDHDARVAVIRREIYYRYRWLVPMEQVHDNEAARIRNDPDFTEPRPPWGEQAT